MKLEVRSGASRSGLHVRKDSETERATLLKKIEAQKSLGRKQSQKSNSRTKFTEPEQVYVSAFDGDHRTLPKYTDSYKSVKNLVPVENCLRAQAGRADQNTLLWQFGLRSYGTDDSSSSRESRRIFTGTHQTNGAGKLDNKNFKTNYATRAGRECSDVVDPMEGMINLPGGGYTLQKFATVDTTEREPSESLSSNLNLKKINSRRSSVGSVSKSGQERLPATSRINSRKMSQQVVHDATARSARLQD